VDDYAQATIEEVSGGGTFGPNGTAYTLNLGTIGERTTPLSVTIGVLNSATGPADLLSGSFNVSNGSAAFVNSNTGSFSGVSAGNEDDLTVALSTGTPCTFTETITLDPARYNASGYSGSARFRNADYHRNRQCCPSDHRARFRARAAESVLPCLGD
jgi:hypothetical protein